jgi:hypothetical protein
VATAKESLRLHSLTTYGYGDQELAEIVEASTRVCFPASPFAPLPLTYWMNANQGDSHLKPGGWYEMQEIHHYPQCHDGSMPPDHPVAQFWGQVYDGLAALNVDFWAVLSLEEKMREAGFVNVSVRVFHVPIGVWPKNRVLKTVGLYWREILLLGVEPIALGPFTRGLKWSREQVELYLVRVRQAYADHSCHSHMPLYIICGQKPEQ